VGRYDIAQVYEAMLTPSTWLAVVRIERSILIEAAKLQAQLKLRLLDAIHVAKPSQPAATQYSRTIADSEYRQGSGCFV
jgi:predicted nucleic acid-binding protein